MNLNFKKRAFPISHITLCVIPLAPISLHICRQPALSLFQPAAVPSSEQPWLRETDPLCLLWGIDSQAQVRISCGLQSTSPPECPSFLSWFLAVSPCNHELDHHPEIKKKNHISNITCMLSTFAVKNKSLSNCIPQWACSNCTCLQHTLQLPIHYRHPLHRCLRSDP